MRSCYCLQQRSIRFYVCNVQNMPSIDATIYDAIVESVGIKKHSSIELRFCFQIAQYALASDQVHNLSGKVILAQSISVCVNVWI